MSHEAMRWASEACAHSMLAAIPKDATPEVVLGALSGVLAATLGNLQPSERGRAAERVCKTAIAVAGAVDILMEGPPSYAPRH